MRPIGFWLVVLFLAGAALLRPVETLWQTLRPMPEATAHGAMSPPAHYEVSRRSGDLLPCVGRKVYDGDTFGCDMNGNGRIDSKRERVRILGIDATEMSYSRKNHTGKDQPYATEAKRYVIDAVMNKTVYLDFDETQRDKYGRTLAYVYRDAKRHRMLNADLVREGLARVWFLGSNRREELALHAIEDRARAQGVNLWSVKTN